MKSKEEILEWQAQADKLVLAKDKSIQRIIEIRLEALEQKDKKERGPLNLSLVLDRSGSMQGEKLHYVKKAAAHVIDLLGANDRASVVHYDDTIEVLFASALMTAENKAEVKQRIASIRSGGSTNLGGGWLKGCEEVARNITERTFNRTLLLTDGLANVGITSLDELAGHANQIFRRSVSTSTFGVGIGYDEHLLEAMANAGGGNFHFLETLNAIPLVFEREFLELINITLKEAELTLQFPAGVKAEVTAGYQSESEGGFFKVYLGSLFSGRKQDIFLRLNIDKSASSTDMSIPILLTAKLEDGTHFEESTSLMFKAVSPAEEAETETNKDLMERYAAVDLADKANEALKRERSGDRIGASRVIMDSYNLNMPYMSDKDRAKYRVLSQQVGTGLSEERRKNYHRDSYQSKRGQEIVRDYHAYLVEGCLLAEIEGQTVLIDSGSQISVGRETEWIFLNEAHQLSQGTFRVTLEHLSKELCTHVDILMGTDILKNYVLTVDLNNERLHFSHHPFLTGGQILPFATPACSPIVKGSISGEAAKLFINTGTKLTYVLKQFTTGHTPIGEEMVFYPTLGRFTTPVYNLPVEIGGINRTVRCGLLPSELEMTMKATGPCAVLGTEYFSDISISIDYPAKKLVLQF